MTKTFDENSQILTKKWQEYAFLGLLLLIAVSMNSYLMIKNPNMGSDALRYHSIFHNLIAGQGYRSYVGNIGANSELGFGMISYLFFLLCGDIELSGMLTSSVSYLLLIPAVYLTVRYLFGNRVAVLATVFITFWPGLISFSYINL